jgi:hypothetical protein
LLEFLGQKIDAGQEDVIVAGFGNMFGGDQQVFLGGQELTAGESRLSAKAIGLPELGIGLKDLLENFRNHAGAEGRPVLDQD